MSDAASLHPIQLNAMHENGEALDPMDPWPPEMMLRPIKSHRQKIWYAGPMLTAMIYEADDGVLTFTDIAYDQHVRILAGQAILTSADGQRHVYAAGDSFIVPKGWSGSWELRDGCREAIIFDTVSLHRAMERIQAQ